MASGDHNIPDTRRPSMAIRRWKESITSEVDFRIRCFEYYSKQQKRRHSKLLLATGKLPYSEQYGNMER